MVPEARLEQTEHGLVADGEGWFVLNLREAQWRHAEGRGAVSVALDDFEGWRNDLQYGVNPFVLMPGEPMAMYHWEADQEAFLVVSRRSRADRRRRGAPVRADGTSCTVPPNTGHVSSARNRPVRRARGGLSRARRATRCPRLPGRRGRRAPRGERRAGHYWTAEPRTPPSPAESRPRTATAGFRTDVLRLLALPLALVAIHSYDSSVEPLPSPLEKTLDARFWEPGCPVPLSDLRLLTVTHWGFDGREHEGSSSSIATQPGARDGLPEAPRAAVSDPAHAARRHVRAAACPAGRR